MPADLSSSIPAALTQLAHADLLRPTEAPHLLAYFATIHDPRRGRGRRHPLVAILAMAAAAVLTGARSMTAIAEWAADTPQPVRAALGACRDAPDRWVVPAEATIRRTLARVDPTALAAVIGAWLADRDRPGQQHRRRAVAVDGRTLRGARRDGRQVHLLAAMDHATRAVLAQRQVNGAAGEVHGFAPLLARSCRTAHPCRSRGESRRAVRRSPAAPRRPSDGVWAGLEPQPPASCHGRERANHQAEPEYQQAAKDSPTDADADGGGDPPSEGPGPCSPSGRPQPPPPPPWAETPGRPTPARIRTTTGPCRREATVASC